MLKYHLKKMQLDFCANWSTTHENLVEDEPKEPDDGGMKQHGDFDIHDHVEDLVRKSEIEEGIGLTDIVIIYKCDTIPWSHDALRHDYNTTCISQPYLSFSIHSHSFLNSSQ